MGLETNEPSLKIFSPFPLPTKLPLIHFLSYFSLHFFHPPHNHPNQTYYKWESKVEKEKEMEELITWAYGTLHKVG